MQLHLLFWLNLAKQNKRGLSPLALRLTYQKQRTQIATGYFLSQAQWKSIQSGEKIKDVTLLTIQEGLDAIKVRLRRLANQLEYDGELTLPNLIELYQAEKAPGLTINQLIKQHNESLHARIGKDRSESTYEKYRFLADKIRRFIKQKLKKHDVFLSKLDKTFILQFSEFLLLDEGNQHNTIVKYCKNLKHVLSYAVEMGHIKENPFIHFKIGYRDIDRSYLTASELELLRNYRFSGDRLALVRDLFIFQCYTGLAYVDMANLTPQNIIEGIDGKPWLVTTRQKTKTRSMVPLLLPAIEIIERHREHKLAKEGHLLPTYAIQKFNSYLKELSIICQFNKVLTSHAGRRTFATTVTLGNGVSLESISKMLGHKNVKMTSLYAVVTDIKLSDEMNTLSRRLDKGDK